MKFIWTLVLQLVLSFVDAGSNSNPCSIDAALTYENEQIYFFKGDRYGRYDDYKKMIDKVAPISKWKGVPNDIDAAIKYKGNYYFFKGCDYYIWDTYAEKVVKDKRDIRESWKAPCDLDAAFTKDYYTYLLKGNKYWLWYNYDGDPVFKGERDIKSSFGVDGPFDAVTRWYQNGKYYFFQGESYQRLDGNDLGVQSSIGNWKGLADSGLELLKDCPCSCSRTQNKENWKMTKIEYEIKRGKVTKLRPSNVVVKRNDLRAIDRCFKECPTVEYTAKKTVTETKKFASTTGIGLKVGTEVEAGVPGLVGGKISMEASVDQKFTYGKDKTETVVRTHHFKCPGFPGTITICRVSMTKSKMDVPYTMTLEHKMKGCVCEEKGFYESVSVGEMMQRVSRKQ